MDEIAAQCRIGRDEVERALRHALRCIHGSHMDRQRTVYPEIQAAMDAAGMSRPELAQKSGMSLTAVVCILSGRTSNPRPESRRAIAAALGLDEYRAFEGGK